MDAIDKLLEESKLNNDPGRIDASWNNRLSVVLSLYREGLIDKNQAQEFLGLVQTKAVQD